MQIDMDAVRLFSFLIFMLMVVPGFCTWVQFKHDERKMINDHNRNNARNTHSSVSSKHRKSKIERYYDIYAFDDCHRTSSKN